MILLEAFLLLVTSTVIVVWPRISAGARTVMLAVSAALCAAVPAVMRLRGTEQEASVRARIYGTIAQACTVMSVAGLVIVCSQPNPQFSWQMGVIMLVGYGLTAAAAMWFRHLDRVCSASGRPPRAE